MKTVRCHDKDGNASDVPVEKLKYRPSVYGVIVQDGKVLLSKQWDGWDFPGGGIDIGERISEALLREVREETGLTVKMGELLLATDDFFVATRERYMHSILLYYSCTDPVGEISTAGFADDEKEYAQAAQWVPVEEAVKLKFFNPVDSAALIMMAAEGKNAY